MLAVGTIRRGLLIACTLSLTCSAMAFTPPTDDQIQAKIDALMKWQKEAKPEERNFESYQKVVAEQLADVNVEELSLAQIEKLSNMLNAAPEKAAAAKKRLEVMAAEKTVDGANAAVIAIGMSMDSEESMAAALKSALSHPMIVEAAKSEPGSEVFGLIGYVNEDALKGMSTEVLALQGAITDDMPAASLRGAMEYLSALNKLGDKVDPATKLAVREKVVGLYGSALEKAKAEATPNKRMIDGLENNLKFLNGAAARGELIDHAAPAMTFLWSSGESPVTSLEQFKGKVVIVDFWATWCGPCIASFPNVAELVERYKDYNVVVLGVTSVQGKHYPGNNQPAIDTEGDTAKEFSLMAEFMKDKKMTWQVAFTEQNVFNPDFGVRGIPHVAIIDAEGKVRYNGLHPMVPMAEKAAKIDGLLKEANLATPGPVVDDEPKAAESEKKPG